MSSLNEKIICMMGLEQVMRDLRQVENPEYTEESWMDTLQMLELLGSNATQQKPEEKAEREGKHTLIEGEINLFPNPEQV